MLRNLLKCELCDAGFEIDNQTLYLKCNQCLSSVVLKDGVYVFEGDSNHTSSFGFQWKLFSSVQLDSHNGRNFSRDRFWNETDWKANEMSGQIILDAGSGSGRFAEIALSAGAYVVAVDYSEAIFETRKNLETYGDRLLCVKSNIEKNPFFDNSFDKIYSIGVLQHTSRPYSAITDLLRCLKPGGKFTFTVYQKRIFTKLHSKYLIRPLTRRVNRRLLLALITKTSGFWFPICRKLFSLPRPIGKMFSFLIPVAVYPKKAWFNSSMEKTEAILDTFDMLSPHYDQPFAARKCEKFFSGLLQVDTYTLKVFQKPGVITGQKAHSNTLNNV